MSHLLDNLKPKQRKGSKPRCHFLTHGAPKQVSKRLTELIDPWGSVATTDHWMPQGFDSLDEAKLCTASRLIPDKRVRDDLLGWWLAVPVNANIPNWDIASTCTIDGQPGLLLIEAKAHDAELRNEERGKELKPHVTSKSRRNHVRIGTCIQDASLSLSEETGLVWALSRDWNYQMANRFTWAWRLVSMGIPTILVYLGLLDCQEMRTASQIPFSNHEDWRRLVEEHGAHLFPAGVWDHRWIIQGSALIPTIRTIMQPLGVDL